MAVTRPFEKRWATIAVCAAPMFASLSGCAHRSKAKAPEAAVHVAGVSPLSPLPEEFPGRPEARMALSEVTRLIDESVSLRVLSRVPRSSGATPLSLTVLRQRLAEAEAYVAQGEHERALWVLFGTTKDPNFDALREDTEGVAVRVALGSAYARLAAVGNARASQRDVFSSKGVWRKAPAYGRIAVRKLVDTAVADEDFAAAYRDLDSLPPEAPSDVWAERAYLNGRGHEVAGQPAKALVAYGYVPPTSRHWAQVTYSQGLIAIEQGRRRDGENLFCKLAVPTRDSRTAILVGDARFFQVRDLARLALGRLAHDQYRFDDSRYYYYLVARDSDRLSEALYEGATGRYEKKDYAGARELLDELDALDVHHVYEDEAQILRAYVELGECKFEDADKRVLAFLTKYEPLRALAKSLAAEPSSPRRLALYSGITSPSGITDASGPGPVSNLRPLMRVSGRFRRAARKYEDVSRELEALRLALTKKEVGPPEQATAVQGKLEQALARLNEELVADTTDALLRLDARLGRLLRRARLARIETVLGRKRGLDADIEAVQSGVLPRDAVDSIDVARYLRDDQEYWPFEGDDWPDEFVSSESLSGEARK